MTAPLKLGARPGSTARPGQQRPGGSPNHNTINDHKSKTNPHNQGKGSGGLGQLSGGHGATGLSASGSFSYAAQAAQLQNNYFAQLAQIRAQKGMIGGQFRMDVAAVKANRIAGAVGAEGDAISRGIIGGSGDLQARSGVVAQAATEKATAIQTRGMGLLGLQQQRIDAQNQYYTGLFSVQAQRQAAEMEAQNTLAAQQMADALALSQYEATPGKDYPLMGGVPPIGNGKGGNGRGRRWVPGRGNHSIQGIQNPNWFGA